MDGEQMSFLWSLATESHSGRLRQTGGVVEETQELTEAKCPLRKRRGKGSVQGSSQVQAAGKGGSPQVEASAEHLHRLFHACFLPEIQGLRRESPSGWAWTPCPPLCPRGFHCRAERPREHPPPECQDAMGGLAVWVWMQVSLPVNASCATYRLCDLRHLT